ncbi:hypothetical protein BDQ94DRAFT_154831 [Aspergillus welwitschiae]|uniref:Uncharacterized protein n=1 Tax=Aspergillus welwitschiae TaxID=1341132 RepID=A0A3F3PJ19_9EURO|nr:hypothetical protein BDQ94DRAFT_154831 [Aspergillus welwitschiae]RDH26919.1 hypothetical protein BDQ94DRAFT_154831 [Aspergillus welwitschiae]
MSISKTAIAVECSKQVVKYIRSNLQVFSSPRAPPTRIEQARSITLTILEALYKYLLKKPGLYLDKIAIFLQNKSFKSRRSLHLHT